MRSDGGGLGLVVEGGDDRAAVDARDIDRASALPDMLRLIVPAGS